MRKHIKQYHNPHFADTQITIPFRGLIISSSGGGKTQMLLNFISKTNDTWGEIIVLYRATEPLYSFLDDKLKGKNITFYTKLSDLPTPNQLDKKYKDKQVLLVIDDFVNEADQSVIQEYAIRGRKCCAGVSMMYLTQSFFKVPKLIRIQMNYLIILKLSSNRDLNLIMSEFSLGLDKNELLDIYKDATKQKFNFLKIDLDQSDDGKKFSKNFTQFYQLKNEDSD